MTERKSVGKLPWSDTLDIFDFKGRLDAIAPKTAIDVGVGLCHTPLSKQLKDYPFDKLAVMDIHEPYIKVLKSQRKTFVAKEMEFYVGKAQDLDQLLDPSHRYDCAILLDIVEHIHTNKFDTQEEAKAVALAFLRNLEYYVDSVLLWIPLGYCPITGDPWGGENHEAHKHYSTWSGEELLELDYAIEYYPGFHNPHVQKYWTPEKKWDCDACYGFKKIR